MRLTFARWSLVVPLALPGALLSRNASQPIVRCAGVEYRTADCRGAVQQLHTSSLDLSWRSAIDETTLGALAGPLAANVTGQHLKKFILIITCVQ